MNKINQISLPNISSYTLSALKFVDVRKLADLLTKSGNIIIHVSASRLQADHDVFYNLRKTKFNALADDLDSVPGRGVTLPSV